MNDLSELAKLIQKRYDYGVCPTVIEVETILHRVSSLIRSGKAIDDNLLYATIDRSLWDKRTAGPGPVDASPTNSILRQVLDAEKNRQM